MRVRSAGGLPAGWPPLILLALAAGCAEHVHHVDEVPVGTEFVYEDREGGELRLTYNGTIEQSGLHWHYFLEDSWIPPVYPSLRFIDVATGGAPFIRSNHLAWENESVPQFGWDLEPGHHVLVRAEVLRYTLDIEVQGGSRHTSLLVEHDVADYGWKRIEYHEFVFRNGDLLPRSIVSSLGWNGEGWDVTGKLARVPP